MNCTEFKSEYKHFTSFPLNPESMNSDRHTKWTDHLYDCQECNDWYLGQQVVERGHDPNDFPCIHIAYHSTEECDEHDDPWECPDIILVRVESSYGIPIRDGGSSFIQIDFCPWCGKKIEDKNS